MSVRGVIKEISRNVKGTSKAGKEYTYTKFVYVTDTGEEKVKQLFKDEVVKDVKAGDNVEIFFKKNDKGFFDLDKICKEGEGSRSSSEKFVSSPSHRSMSDKDFEIEVMNALNVASSLESSKSVTDVVGAAKEILKSKAGLVAFAKDVRTKVVAKGTGDDPFEDIT